MNCKIFVSHASTDRIYANLLVDFLTNGLGLDNSDVFCSSVAGSDIPIGVDFNEYILSKIKESSEFFTIAIISNSYYNSRYCIYELGAAWGLGKTNDSIIPFIVEDMDRGGPKDFILFKQSVIGESLDDINKLSDKIRSIQSMYKRQIPTEKFEKERERILTGIHSENLDRKKKTSKSSSSESKTPRIKLVAFDFDGTILQGKNYRHSWMAIWRFLNYDDSERKSLQEKHKSDSKAYNFQEWCNECVKHFKAKNFEREHVKHIIEASNLKLATNFEEVIKVLNAFGIKMIIISGGIDTFIEEVLEDNIREYFDEIYVNKFFYNKDGLLDSVSAYQTAEADGVGKIKALEKYCIENNISLSEVAYVGDQINDIDVLQVVGRPIVYPADRSHPHMRVKQLKFHMVHDDSMVHILPAILD